MATVKESYPSTAGTITFASTSLSNNNQAPSQSVDNTTNLDLDALVQVKFTNGTVSGTPFCNVYVYGTSDGGTTWDDGLTPNAAASTSILTSSPNVALVAVVNSPTSSATYTSR